MIEDYLESSAFPTRVMYSCPNVATIHRLVQLNMGTPTYMRAPGVATGTYAVEVAMDELAYELKMDPLQLRLMNYTDVDPHTKIPFSEKNLRECYTRAAERFGWSKRSHAPRSMREGKLAIGWGMATETYPGKNLPAAALVRLQPNGTAVVASGTQEIGTGMYTVMTQVAADTLNMSPRSVYGRSWGHEFAASANLGRLDDDGERRARSPGSRPWLRSQLIAMATQDAKSPVHGGNESDVEFQDGKIFLKSAPGRCESFQSLLARHGNQPIEAGAQVKPEVNKNSIPFTPSALCLPKSRSIRTCGWFGSGVWLPCLMSAK